MLQHQKNPSYSRKEASKDQITIEISKSKESSPMQQTDPAIVDTQPILEFQDYYHHFDSKHPSTDFALEE